MLIMIMIMMMPTAVATLRIIRVALNSCDCSYQRHGRDAMSAEQSTCSWRGVQYRPWFTKAMARHVFKVQPHR